MYTKRRCAVDFDQRHGGPYDRGTADSYYGRGFNPHYFKGSSYLSDAVTIDDMTAEEIMAYKAGYEDNDAAGDFKEW